MISAHTTVELTYFALVCCKDAEGWYSMPNRCSAEKAHSGHEFYWQGSKTCSQAEGCRSFFTSVAAGLSTVCAGTVTVTARLNGFNICFNVPFNTVVEPNVGGV